MNPSCWKTLRLAALALAGFTFGQESLRADVLSGGFDTATGNLANDWNNLGGKVRGGTDGGFGWNAGYFGGTYPTNNTFASTMEGPVRQDLAGAGSTFVEGTTYTLRVSLFSASNYGASNSSSILWNLAFTADGTAVARDQWFSDEFTSQTVANGGPIPDDHILSVTSSSTGLRTVTLSYTATAADAGKVIGVQLGGDTPMYTLLAGAPTPDDYFGMMDNVTVVSSGTPLLTAFVSDKPIIDASPTTLSWTVVNPTAITSLTLDSGSGPVNVLALTNTTTGLGAASVNPTQTTIYTLTLNGTSSLQVTLSGGDISSFRSERAIARISDNHKLELKWQVKPFAPTTLTLSDGTNTIDVTGNTNPVTGAGSRVVTVTAPQTIFTLNLNNSSDTATFRVAREAGNSAAFSLDKVDYATGEVTTATWSGTTGNPDSWVAIYSANLQIEANFSTQWNYLNGTKTAGGNLTSGSLPFTLPDGDYYAVLMLDGGYTFEQGPVFFRVGAPPTVEMERFQIVSTAKTANSFSITWESKAGYQYKIYASDSLEGIPALEWEVLEAALPSAGDGTTSYTETLPLPAPSRRFYRIYGTGP